MCPIAHSYFVLSFGTIHPAHREFLTKITNHDQRKNGV